MAFVVIYDACVLYPAPVRDLLLRIANTGIVRARWSERILDECFRSIIAQRPDLAPEALERTRRLMREAVPDCMVTGFEHLEDSLDLPDPDDRHVLAAAIRANAQTVVTFNLRDFPDHVLARYDIESKHPDEFVLDSLDLAPGAVVQCVTDQAGALRTPPMTTPEVLDTLRRLGLVRSVARFRELLSAA
ncbi:MAG: PIN domain-containing protein [Gemmatimonadaceae bacterium]